MGDERCRRGQSPQAAMIARRYDTGRIVRLEVADDALVGISDCPPEAADHLGPIPWVAPGLIDIQVNGYGGQEFSAPTITPEKVASIAAVMPSFGVTRFLPTLTTESHENLLSAARCVVQACRQSPETDRLIAGIHLEGPYISPQEGARGAHPRQHCRLPDFEEFQRLQEAAEGRIRLITLAPELPGALDFIRCAAAAGVIVAIGHTMADWGTVRAAADAGARLSTHLGNGCPAVLPRHNNCIWAQLAEDRLWASLIVDGHHLPPPVVKSLVRAKSPERCILVSDMSGMAGLPPGRYPGNICDVEILPDGKLVIAGQRELLAGATAAVCVGLVNVMHFAGLSLSEAVAMATSRPAALAGIACSAFEQPTSADLVVFDLRPAADDRPGEIQVRASFSGGRLSYRAA